MLKARRLSRFNKNFSPPWRNSSRDRLKNDFRKECQCESDRGDQIIKRTYNGSKNGMSKISEEEVLRYRREYTSGRSKKSIIDECRLTRKTVENFCLGELTNWFLKNANLVITNEALNNQGQQP